MKPLPSELAPWNNPNMRWVCENHPDKEWETECECGAGMPDPKLYDHLGQPLPHSSQP